MKYVDREGINPSNSFSLLLLLFLLIIVVSRKDMDVSIL